MFFNVDDSASFGEVYGVKGKTPTFIDPHLILNVRQIGYDNTHRNALSEVFIPALRPAFCKYLNRKFPEFDNFLVVAVSYSSLTSKPQKRFEKIIYQCSEGKADE